LLLIGSLYVSQALPIGFVQEALPVILYRQGIEVQHATLVRLVLLPWVLKFLWAPWIDKRTVVVGRKALLLPLQLGIAIFVAGLALLDAGQQTLEVLGIIVVLNVLCATQDIVTDSLAVQHLGYAERGPGNGIQAGGYQLGLILGRGGLLLLYGYIGWGGAMTMMALVMALPIILILLLQEPSPLPAPARFSTGEVIRGFFMRPGMRSWVPVILLYLMGNSWALAAFSPLLIDAGLSNAQIGWLIGVVGILSGVAGAAAGGWWLQFASRRVVMLAAGGLLIAGLFSYLIPAFGFTELPVLYGVCMLNKFAGGVASAALFTLMMDHSRKEHPGSDFTVQQSLFNLATITAAFSGTGVKLLGYPGQFLLCLGIGVAGFWVVWRGVPHVQAPLQPEGFVEKAIDKS